MNDESAISEEPAVGNIAAPQAESSVSKVNLDALPKAIWFERDATSGVAEVRIIDQTRLPMQGDVLCCRTLEAVETAIKTLAVRGAPALGIAAGLALAVWSFNECTETEPQGYLVALETAAERIASARPTAVNLQREAQRLVVFAHEFVAKAAPKTSSLDELKEAVLKHALSIAKTDEAHCKAIGKAGATLLKKGAKVLTICNTGALATGSIGTALGVVYTASAQEKLEHVWVCETRPVNQGSRLTAWELATAGVPYTLISDSMAASVMAKGWVDAVFVGADRICANGDVANKIGTLSLAILAKHHNIPFYVCAPSSTIDAETKTGAEVDIEQRDPRELAGFTATGVILPQNAQQTTAFDILTEAGLCELTLRNGQQLALERKGGAYAFDAWFATTPSGVQIYNPCFDITPAELITGIITEDGVDGAGR
ncbi:MAG: S-methyl-5-thioribose-1-phosphate isomerase [Coriobacteriia bacterium]|nr:S-methyl-5-thioribose-1-phosphate isomerase [Coriobacteriia bacterium]